MYMRNYGCYQTINRVNIFSFTWRPEKEPITCLSFTYKLKTSNGRTYELILKNSFTNLQIISVKLEKGVGSIIILFYIMGRSTFI